MDSTLTTKATAQPRPSTASCSPVNTMPSIRYLPTFRALAPNMTGMARKKVNSAATGRLAPRSRPPTMVAPLREVPGIMASTCQKPMISASL